MRNEISCREFDKFKAVGNDTAVNVNLINGAMSGIVWDTFSVDRPDAVTEVYSFFKTAILQIKIQLIFTDSTKKHLAGGGVLP